MSFAPKWRASRKGFVMFKTMSPWLVFVLALACLAETDADREKAQPPKEKKLVLPKEAGDITGYYTCKGVETGNKKYSGLVVIGKKNNVYIVTWVIAGSSTFTGIGVRQGDTFAASWIIPGDGGKIVRGVNLYKIEPGPKLSGVWAALPGPGIQQRETLGFVKPLEPEED